MSLPSPDSSSELGGHRKPHADVYTVLLVVAFLALSVATALLYFDTSDFGSPPYSGAPSASAAPSRPSEIPGAQLCFTGWLDAIG